MYLITTNGVLVYKGIEKKEEYFLVSDEQNLVLQPNCNDCDSRGYLLVDTAQSNYSFVFNKHLNDIENKDASENFVKRYNFRNLMH